MPWRVPPPNQPELPPRPTSIVTDAQSTMLMLQWVFWKHLAPKIVLDPERFQRLAERLAEEFFAEGVRMPITDHPEETVIELQHELRQIVKELPPIPVPQARLRERQRFTAERLYKVGWRKIATVVAVLIPHVFLAVT